jgi:hypothetical protein
MIENRKRTEEEIEAVKAETEAAEIRDTREMTYKQLADMYGISEAQVRLMDAVGVWSGLVVDVYLERHMNGEEYDDLKNELAEIMYKMDNIVVGSKAYTEVMNIFSQVLYKAGRKDKRDSLVEEGVDVREVARKRKEEKRKERIEQLLKEGRDSQ